MDDLLLLLPPGWIHVPYADDEGFSFVAPSGRIVYASGRVAPADQPRLLRDLIRALVTAGARSLWPESGFPASAADASRIGS